MQWFRAHLYFAAIIFALLLIGVGTVIVASNAPVAPHSLVAWGGVGALAPTINESNSQSAGEPTLMQQVMTSAPYNYALPLIPSAPPAPTSTQGFDMNAFLSLISHTGTTTSAAAGAGASTSVLTDAYSFIPGGLIAGASPTPTLTPTQQALHDYGNAAGAVIQTFENAHTNEAQVLQEQSADPTNPQKAAALQALGADLAGVGTSLLSIQGVPPEASSAHEALANSYIEIGTELSAVASAQGQDAMVAAMETYDTSVDTFVSRYVTLAELFPTYGVTFSHSEPGSVFIFDEVSL